MEFSDGHQAYMIPEFEMLLCFWDQIVYMSSRKQSRVSCMIWVEISFLRLESFGINKNVQTAVTGLKLKSWLEFVWDLYTRCRTEMNFSSHEMLGKRWEIYTVIAMVTKLLRIIRPRLHYYILEKSLGIFSKSQKVLDSGFWNDHSTSQQWQKEFYALKFRFQAPTFLFLHISLFCTLLFSLLMICILMLFESYCLWFNFFKHAS